MSDLQTDKDKELDRFDAFFNYKVPEDVLKNMRALKVATLRTLNKLIRDDDTPTYIADVVVTSETPAGKCRRAYHGGETCRHPSCRAIEDLRNNK